MIRFAWMWFDVLWDGIGFEFGEAESLLGCGVVWCGVCGREVCGLGW